jgi:hypothetical protein
METVIGLRKEVGLKENTGKATYMLMPRHQNSGQHHNIKIGNRSFVNVAKLRYLAIKNVKLSL